MTRGSPPSQREEEDDAGRPRGRRGFFARLPRPESSLLILAVLWTAAAKAVVVVGQEAESPASALMAAILPDAVFFAAMFLVFALLYCIGVPRLVSRATLLAAVIVLAWAVANAAWLLATSVQLQPGVLGVLLGEPAEFWPIVQDHLAKRLLYAVPIFLTLAAAGVWFIWRLVRPRPLPAGRGPHVRHAALAAVVLILSVFGVWLGKRGGEVAYSGQVIGFSSHWYAVRRLTTTHAWDVDGDTDVSSAGRMLPRVGERGVVLPDDPGAARPNVVVILLESVSYDATSLGPTGQARTGQARTGQARTRRSTTPYLARLAAEGVEFVETRVPVAQTSKAFWATFTGCTPDLLPDYAESVPVDEPYESLSSMLAASGYRSAFFQMSRGSFECAPGMFSNLGFDWAWFRENLEDESAYLGYMNGDDERMIEPMFEWVDAPDAPDAPFLLGMITSVAHDPYELPASYPEPPHEDRFERYLQAVHHGDMIVQEVCDQLERRGILDDTIVCVLGDHGDGFRPKSKSGRWAPFEEVIRIPWVIRWPAGVEAGRKVEWPCSQLDVTPTILALLGADISEAGFDGQNALVPTTGDRRQFFSTWYEASPIGYVEGRRKLVYWPYTDTLFEYDLAGDPGELEQRTIDGPEKASMIAAVREWVSGSRMEIPARRFRESLEYRYWRTFSAGRSAWAYYVPRAASAAPEVVADDAASRGDGS